MYIEILILYQLNFKQKHGYEIKKEVENILGEKYSINNNMLYPILKHFEDMGAVQKQIEQQEGKPNRHIYTITEIGVEILLELIRDFPEDIASNDHEFLVRVGLLDLLDIQTRKEILHTRKVVIEKNLSHTKNIKAYNLDKHYLFPYKVIEFQITQIELELQWISELQKECMAKSF